MNAPGRFLIAVAATLTLFGCSSKGPRVIPEDDFARIYADMFIADEWMRNHSELRIQTDTMLVYEPIFRNYGYTTEDYWASVDHYLDDPKSYGKILGKSADIIKKQNNGFIEIRQARKDSVEREHRRQHLADSVAHVRDSMYKVPCRIPLYRDRIFFCDTLPYRDTVFALDTVRWRLLDFDLDSLNAVRDSLTMVRDSLTMVRDSSLAVKEIVPGLKDTIKLTKKPMLIIEPEEMK